ncbi:hypothetical protein HaLaN_21294 [Haematococcus lacustris]|uniref:Uncharacterized protein n=1 Tax=Haematococcus lacustris TaxID=44745 RepID=A0A699ZRA8_HAELA|nr:hypothetical protein HaLaN_21294 [Haematococcus lacustris]
MTAEQVWTMVHPIILETRRYYTERMSFMANMPYSFAQLGDTDVLARRHAAKLYTSLTGHLTPRIEEHLARVYRPVPITNAGCETALKPLSSSRVDRMGAAQVAAHVKAHTEPLHTWYQYITEDSLATNRAAKRQRVADAKAPSCVLVATPINTTASPLLSAATLDPSPNPAPTLVPIPTATPSYATRAGAATVTRKLQEQQRREKRAAAELSITMKLASAEACQQYRATAAEQQAAAKEQANTRARMATQQLQVIAMYSSMIQPLPQNTLKLSLHQLRQLWGVVGKGPPARTVGGLGCGAVGMHLQSIHSKCCMSRVVGQRHHPWHSITACLVVQPVLLRTLCHNELKRVVSAQMSAWLDRGPGLQQPCMVAVGSTGDNSDALNPAVQVLHAGMAWRVTAEPSQARADLCRELSASLRHFVSSRRNTSRRCD